MNKVSAFLFGNWLQPVLFTFVSSLILLVGFFSGIGILEVIGFSMFAAGYLWMLVSMIVLFFRKEWWKGFYMFVFMITFIITFGLMQ